MRFSPWKLAEISVPFAEKIRARVLRPSSSDSSQRIGVLVDRFAPCSGLGGLSSRAARDQRCHADLVSALGNLCGMGALPSARHLQTGRGLLHIQPPVHLSLGHQPWAVQPPLDLSTCICCGHRLLLTTHLRPKSGLRTASCCI